jgi:hypothetical protein
MSVSWKRKSLIRWSRVRSFQGMLIISSGLAGWNPASSGLAGWSDASPYQGVRGI